MKNLLKLISLFVMLVCIKSLTMAQCFNEPEEVEAPESTFFDTECTPEFFSKNGRYLPTKGIIRILVVFAEIDYSYISGTDPTGPDGTPEWPAHQLPDWADDIEIYNL